MAQLVSGRMSPKGWRTKATEPHMMRAVNNGGGMCGGFIDPASVMDPALQRRQDREKAATIKAAARTRRNQRAKARARARKAAA